ncbi:MAG TPA: FAD:protein FMN transferase [Candidatus Limnocylindrales bacterium]|nr:FAD:protein FMN transferase [Candidatus Limnocylindrales bacterium]
MSDQAATEAIHAFAGRALGSPLRLQVRAASTADAGRAWAEITDEFDAVDLALSRFRADSELTALNARAGSGEVLRVSWRLREAVAAMARAARVTGGRFDPMVGPDLDLLGELGADPLGATPPDPATLDRPRPVTAPPTPLDTGGIGKGLALRWAARRAHAVLPADAGLFLEAGGDIVMRGVPPPQAWRVGLEDPVTAGQPGAEPAVVVAADGGAVATSSVRVRNWAAPDGRRVHHLIDPRTRAPARTGLLAVTVAGPDPAWAEVWTKALFLAGRSAIGEEARARGLAAWWVTDEGRLGLTPAARERTLWVREERVG